MNKPFAKSNACAAKTLFAVMKEMKKRGGNTDESNCQMLCKTHNRAKGNR